MEKGKNFLENRVVIVKPIPDMYNPEYTRLDKDHCGKFRLPYCAYFLSIPLTEGGLLKILNKEEQEFFEKELYMAPGSLSFYRKGNNKKDPDNYNFWYGFMIKLYEEEEIQLNLADPIENLKWRVLKVCKEIAPNWESRQDKPSYRWALIDANYKIKANTSLGEVKATAYAEYSKIKDVKSRLQIVLKVMGKIFTNDVDISVLQNEIINIIERPKSSTELNVEDFLRAVQDNKSNTKALLTDAINSKEIIKKRNIYTLRSGDEIARSFDEAVDWLDDVENQETRKTIELKIRANNES